ncbi:MAG: class I SAM-dependent methyltransferase [Desulfopila sp.]
MTITATDIARLTRIFLTQPGYLKESGWLRSQAEGAAVDAAGKPLPWITYPAIDFLQPRIRPWMTVFEYGSGNSTFWWSARVARLISCEHDKEWYADFQPRIRAANTTYLLRRCKGGSTAYADEISRYGKTFDILVIDGRDRVNCIRNGLGALRDGGVVLWDNSDRQEYQPGYDLLEAAGFRRLDFWGGGALSTRRWCTSIFYRPDNCLGI